MGGMRRRAPRQVSAACAGEPARRPHRPGPPRHGGHRPLPRA